MVNRKLQKVKPEQGPKHGITFLPQISGVKSYLKMPVRVSVLWMDVLQLHIPSVQMLLLAAVS